MARNCEVCGKAQGNTEFDRHIHFREYTDLFVGDIPDVPPPAEPLAEVGGFPPVRVCPKCNAQYWALVDFHPPCGPVGMVPCPATHDKDKAHCVLCRQTPGWVEEAV